MIFKKCTLSEHRDVNKTVQMTLKRRIGQRFILIYYIYI